jgi:site-specific recombinase XerD
MGIEAAVTAGEIETYARHLKAKPSVSPTTASRYIDCLHCYEAWLNGRPISKDTAQDFIGFLREKNYSWSTVRIYYHALKPFLAEQLGIEFHVKFKKVKRLPLYHSPEQIKSILDMARNRTDRWKSLSERDSLIILVLAYTGMRRSELLSLCLSNINFQTRTIRIVGKGNRERLIPIADALFQPLMKYTKTMKPTQRIFPLGPNRLDVLVRKYAQAAGINDITPHSFRHYFITQVIKNAADPSGIYLAQQLAGHSSIETTAIYLDIVPEHLTDAVQRLPKLTGDKPCLKSVNR